MVVTIDTITILSPVSRYVPTVDKEVEVTNATSRRAKKMASTLLPCSKMLQLHLIDGHYSYPKF